MSISEYVSSVHHLMWPFFYCASLYFLWKIIVSGSVDVELAGQLMGEIFGPRTPEVR